TALSRERPPRLRIGWSTRGLMGLDTDHEVAQAVAQAASLLIALGHEVVEESPEPIGLEAMASMANIWFFGFHRRLEGFSKRTGHEIGPQTLEPVTLAVYEYARRMTPAQFLDAG